MNNKILNSLIIREKKFTGNDRRSIVRECVPCRLLFVIVEFDWRLLFHEPFRSTARQTIAENE
jgi:hypothetical protein